MWSSYLGRPESLDNLDITTHLPTAKEDCHSDTYKEWQPYIDEDRPAANGPSQGHLDEVASGTVALCSKMASIRKAL